MDGGLVCGGDLGRVGKATSLVPGTDWPVEEAGFWNTVQTS